MNISKENRYKAIERYYSILHSLLQERKNVFFLGFGGAGKSYSIRKVANKLVNKGYNVGVVSTTGVSAVGLGLRDDKKLTAKKLFPCTLHSWAGIGLAKESAKKLIAKIMCNPRARANWLEIDILFIDEVSMLSAGLFEKLDFIGREIRKDSSRPFGGLQLVVSADFLQLPPIGEYKVEERFAFESEAWEECEFEVYNFKEPMRFGDDPKAIEHHGLLSRLRKAKHTKEDIQRLSARVTAYRKLDLKNMDTLAIKPTIIYSKKKDVKAENERELENLKTEQFRFIAKDTFKEYTKKAKYEFYMEKLDNCVEKVIYLKVGAQVMLTANLDVAGGLVNGSRGVVIALDSITATVKFKNGEEKQIGMHTWEYEDKHAKAARSQIPFLLAWSSTIHKTQGMTLDCAIIDAGPSVFAKGQAYVAISRVSSIDGLYLSNFYPPAIKVNEKALAFCEKCEREEEERVKNEKVVYEFV